MFALLLSLLITTGPCYVHPDSLRPIAPPCSPAFAPQAQRFDATWPPDCATVYHDGAQFFVRGFVLAWPVSQVLGEHRPLATGIAGQPDDGACLCSLWARYPDYVLWERGNPCEKGVS